MYLYPNDQSDMYDACPNIWDLDGQQSNLTWRRPPQEAKHVVSHWRDLDGAKMEFIFQKDLYIKGWFKTRRRRKACLPIYYGTGIERPKDNYDYTKLWRIQEKLEKLKGSKKKSKVQRNIPTWT